MATVLVMSIFRSLLIRLVVEKGLRVLRDVGTRVALLTGMRTGGGESMTGAAGTP